MCVSPITIRRRLDNYDKPSVVNRLRKAGLVPYVTDEITVPCGKCIECLRKRQMDLSTRCIREAEKRGSMAFLTLTYNDDSLPLACSLMQVHKDTGEVRSVCGYSLMVRQKTDADSKVFSDKFLSIARGRLFNIAPGPSPRVFNVPAFTEYPDTEFNYFYSITPSLNRRDVRLWLKQCRVDYKREFGKPLPEFSYVVCGEMGPNTCRPHYHLAFFGLPIKDVRWCADRWYTGKLNFGFYNLKQVNAVNADGSSGFQIASKYIGKYMSKGKFECQSVKDCLCEKPRLMLSKNLGSELTPRLVSYFRCYDLFGEYDIDTCTLKDGSLLSSSQLSAIATEVRKRNHFSIGSYNYSIPNCIIKKLWYVPSEKNDGSFRASTIRNYFSSLVSADSVENFMREARSSAADKGTEYLSQALALFVSVSETSSELSQTAAESSLQNFYHKSIF